MLNQALQKFLGEPFLFGFDLVRRAQKQSRRQGTTHFHRAQYLPTDHQGDPQRDYAMLNDIYSFGVLLLEIALWTSFVGWEPGLPQTEGMGWIRSRVLLESGN